MKSILGLFQRRKKRGSSRKIGILYICTGKYHIFWDEFYKTAERRFCLDSELHYFVFSDHAINTHGNPRVHLIHQKKLGWPFDTLMRFHIFLQQRSLLEKMDYLFFFNANMKFVTTIREAEVLPEAKHHYLVGVRHYWYHDHQRVPPFETNPQSEAYVDAKIELKYYQGCLSGGRTKEYLEMCEAITGMVDKDGANNYIAIWHDESYLNRYFQTKEPMGLPPSYAYPEEVKSKMERKILMFDKKKYGGHANMRA